MKNWISECCLGYCFTAVVSFWLCTYFLCLPFFLDIFVIFHLMVVNIGNKKPCQIFSANTLTRSIGTAWVLGQVEMEAEMIKKKKCWNMKEVYEEKNQKLNIWVELIRMGNMPFLCHFLSVFMVTWSQNEPTEIWKKHPVDKYTKESNGHCVIEPEFFWPGPGPEI